MALMANRNRETYDAWLSWLNDDWVESECALQARNDLLLSKLAIELDLIER